MSGNFTHCRGADANPNQPLGARQVKGGEQTAALTVVELLGIVEVGQGCGQGFVGLEHDGAGYDRSGPWSAPGFVNTHQGRGARPFEASINHERRGATLRPWRLRSGARRQWSVGRQGPRQPVRGDEIIGEDRGQCG